MRRAWYRFRRNPLSVAGLAVVVGVALLALLAPQLSPYPAHAGSFLDFANASKAPSLAHPFGTDTIGRDVLTRVIFAYRVSLLLAVVVLGTAAPLGILMGLLAGYHGGRVETALMRLTDIFISVPPLVLALAILGFLEPTLTNAMLAVSAMWWPWYARLSYNLARAVRVEDYVMAAEVVGASTPHILFREILPNCIPALLTKITLDMGFVILIGSSLSFLGLGVQPPTPDLGTMVADGAKFLPDLWWIAVFPGLAILIVVLGFNLLGDGLRDLFGMER